MICSKNLGVRGEKNFKNDENGKALGSDEWRRSTLVLIFKNKEDIQNYTNY
jgi:hypothetical protein